MKLFVCLHAKVLGEHGEDLKGAEPLSGELPAAFLPAFSRTASQAALRAAASTPRASTCPYHRLQSSCRTLPPPPRLPPACLTTHLPLRQIILATAAAAGCLDGALGAVSWTGKSAPGPTLRQAHASSGRRPPAVGMQRALAVSGGSTAAERGGGSGKPRRRRRKKQAFVEDPKDAVRATSGKKWRRGRGGGGERLSARHDRPL